MNMVPDHKHAQSAVYDTPNEHPRVRSLVYAHQSGEHSEEYQPEGDDRGHTREISKGEFTHETGGGRGGGDRKLQGSIR